MRAELNEKYMLFIQLLDETAIKLQKIFIDVTPRRWLLAAKELRLILRHTSTRRRIARAPG